MMQESKIIVENTGALNVPDCPVIPFIEGDGIGPDIWAATVRVLDASIEQAYTGTKKISWLEVFAGEKGFEKSGSWLPDETLNKIREHVAAIKGPLTTPVGKGFRSLNVTIRQKLDLYACVRPIRYIEGVPSPMKHPEKINMVVFRENTEDVYAGIEWAKGTREAERLIAFLESEMKIAISKDSGIGIKPISETASKRLVASAIRHALDHDLGSVTLMHKGNIMKFTEGAFKEWGYEAAEELFGDQTVTEAALWVKYDGVCPEGKVVIKDRIADMMFQQVLLRPEEYQVIATPNLNGDYISDALAAQAGGLGLAPGANIGDRCAVFEATHGTAPKYAGQDKVNPGSLILSGAMMLDFIGWQKAAEKIRKAVQKTICDRVVTYDLARQLEGARKVKCSEFATALIEHL